MMCQPITFNIYTAKWIKPTPINFPDEKKVAIIVKVCADFIGIHTDVIYGGWRKREVVEIRQIAQEMCINNTRLPIISLANNYFNRDHSTLIHSRETVDDLFTSNKEFRAKYLDIQSLIERKFKLTNKR